MPRALLEVSLAGAQREHVFEARAELDNVDGLVQKVVDSDRERALPHDLVARPGDHEHGNVGFARNQAELLRERDAVHLGHVVVDDDDVRIVMRAPFECFVGAQERDRLSAAELADVALQKCERNAFVVQ